MAAERIWLKMSRSTGKMSLVTTTYSQTDDSLALAPIPVVGDPRRGGRMSYEAWRYICADEIEAAVQDMLDVVSGHMETGGPFGDDEQTCSMCLDIDAFTRDAYHWLYLNSASAMRDSL